MPKSRDSYRPVAGSLDGWTIQRNVINALVYRELKTRVSQVKFGVLGVFLEPLGVIAVFLCIFVLLRGGRNANGLDLVLFLSCGVVLYTMASEIAVRSLKAMDANEALFFYRPVKPIDTVIARSLVEAGLYGVMFLVIIFATFLFREQWILQDFALMVSSYVALVLTAFGLGLFLMVAGHRYPAMHQVVPWLVRPLWFLSGIFFSINTMPYWLKPWISWNPIFQAIELTRYSLSSDYILDGKFISLPYLLSCSVVSCAVGLWVYSNNERILLTR